MQFFNLISKKVKRTVVFLLIAFTVIAGFRFVNSDFEIVKNLDIFASTIRELNKNYVDPINPGELTKKAIDAMLYSLDPYTNFITESDIEDVRFMTTGQYGGIGALVQEFDSNFVISEPYENYTAQKAGLLAGDIILEINGKSIKGRSIDEVSKLLKGQKGTPITLTVQRPGTNARISRELIREDVKIENIPHQGILDEGIGYIKLEGFTQNAGMEVHQAFLSLKQKYPGMKGLILDLRGNGGGLLNEAVNIVNLFVDKDFEVVSTKGRSKERNQVYKTLNPAVDSKIPLVVMVDPKSASASEIVAGAIQDLDRGLIVGEPTFGKGLVQNVVPLSYNAQLKVTVAKYYIPSGRCVQAIDYTHRTAGGRASSIADSLRMAYKTKNGRIVYDGHGIDPDVLIPVPELAPISKSLISRNHIFNFATNYHQRTPSISSAEEFKISSDIYADFTTYLKNKEYSYQTRSEIALEKFRETALSEGYINRMTEEFQNLNANLKRNKADDLSIFKEEISHLLRQEIVTRYYFQKGRLISNLKHDASVKAAIKLLSNDEEYQKLLQPGRVIRHKPAKY